MVVPLFFPSVVFLFGAVLRVLVLFFFPPSGALLLPCVLATGVVLRGKEASREKGKSEPVVNEKGRRGVARGVCKNEERQKYGSNDKYKRHKRQTRQEG